MTCAELARLAMAFLLGALVGLVSMAALAARRPDLPGEEGTA
jgi:hypothetical protein